MTSSRSAWWRENSSSSTLFVFVFCFRISWIPFSIHYAHVIWRVWKRGWKAPIGKHWFKFFNLRVRDIEEEEEEDIAPANSIFSSDISGCRGRSSSIHGFRSARRICFVVSPMELSSMHIHQRWFSAEMWNLFIWKEFLVPSIISYIFFSSNEQNSQIKLIERKKKREIEIE